MNKNPQDIFNKTKQVILSPDEKKKMKARLELFIEAHPVRNIAGSRHLLQDRSRSYISAFAEIFKLKPFISKPQPMAIIVIIALFIGGGTSFAAENALPGDILYPIKVNVNEEVRSVIAISNEAQAEWDARRAERRLEEAEQLAAEGRLSTEMRTDIESRFENHAEAFQKGTEKMEARQEHKASFEIHSNFEASLKAHERVLTRIATEKTNTREEVEPLLVEVHTRLNTTTKARGNVETAVSAETNVTFKTSAEGKLKAAENKINEVRSFITRVKSSTSASAYREAEIQLTAAEKVIVRGKAEAEAKTYGKAFASFQEAIRIAQEAQLLVAAEKQIDIEIKAPDDANNIKNGSEQETPPENSLEIESETKAESGNAPTEERGEEKLRINIEL